MSVTAADEGWADTLAEVRERLARLETQADQAERLHELLERYHFTEQLAIHRRDLGPAYETVRAADCGSRPATVDAAARWAATASASGASHLRRRS